MRYIKMRIITAVALTALLFVFGLLGNGCAPAAKEALSDSAFEGVMSPDYYDQNIMKDSDNDWSEGEHKISTADVKLKVEDLVESFRMIEEKVKNLGGFVSYSVINKRENNPNAQVTLRVPADRFTLMLDEVEKIGEVDYRITSEENVTRRYIDLEARIKNLTSQEKRLTEILQLADKVEEVLSVEKELERVRGEIEVLTGEFNYLKNQVNMATIIIQMTETTLAASGIASIDFKDVFTRGYHSLISSINLIIMFVRGSIIFIMGSLPFILLAAVVIIVLKKPFRFIRERGKTPPVN